MKRISFILCVMCVLLVISLFVPVVTAEELIYNNSLSTSHSIVKNANLTVLQTTDSNPHKFNEIYFYNGESLRGIQYIEIIYNSESGYAGNNTLIPSGTYYTTYTCFGKNNPATIHITRSYNPDQSVNSTDFFIILDNLDDVIKDNEASSGILTLNDFYIVNTTRFKRIPELSADNSLLVIWRTDRNWCPINLSTLRYKTVKDWQNYISIIKNDNGFYKFSIQREFDDNNYLSNVTGYHNDSLLFTNTSANNFDYWYYVQAQKIDQLFISSVPAGFSATWLVNIDYGLTEEPEEPEEPISENKTFTVFIRDGNTYEPIDSAEIAFKSYNTGQWVLNKTVTGGSAYVSLPGGFYYVYIIATGYYQYPHPVQIFVDDNLVSSMFNVYQVGDIPEPEEPTDFLDLTVSVKNSQTGALISGSEIGIRKYGDTEFYQNRTLSSGYTTVFLPPGIYEIFAEAPGYYQVYPARITLDQPHENTGVFLHPSTLPAPEGNVTLNVWVCYIERGSGQATGISTAEVVLTGTAGEGVGYVSGNLTTDLGGFLTLDVPANTTYIAYAEKPGYLSGTNHFTVFGDSPVTLTIQMIKEVPPTVPVVTPAPTFPTPPTPTEPPGFMETSGKAIGDLFGVSLEIGKMMLGGLICLAVGTATAKNLKGGAPEFCVGFLGAAFLTTMGGLIPVGFFVAMLLLMGIYIARAYLLGGENGG